MPLFINNVHKDASTTDISKYILSKTQLSVKLEKVNMKLDKDYNAYKIFVPSSRLSDFMDENLWPEGVSFRRFINFRYKGTENVNTIKVINLNG